MARRSPQTHAKRQREAAKKQKRQDKLERRAQRKQQRAEGTAAPELMPVVEDPNEPQV